MTPSTTTYDGGLWYVYALIDPATYRRTGSQLLSVFYVGKGAKDRAEQHEKEERKALQAALATLPMGGSKQERIRQVLGSGERVPAITLASGFVDESDAYAAETLAMELIGRLLSAHRLDPLTNAIPGHGQSRGQTLQGQPHALGGPGLPTPVAGVVDDEPAYEFRSVSETLHASTSVKADWVRDNLVPGPTILVKGNTESIPGGSHALLPTGALPPALQDVADRILPRDEAPLAHSDFVRRGWDPDDPWTDHEARERASRYWPFAKTLVRGWLRDTNTMPSVVLMAIPGSGGTTVRYAWELDRTAPVEFFPALSRWGFPLAERLLDHPALGRCLVGDRGDGKQVQVLYGYTAGCRLLLPQR